MHKETKLSLTASLQLTKFEEENLVMLIAVGHILINQLIHC